MICSFGCVYDVDIGLLGGWVSSMGFDLYAICVGGRGIGCVWMLNMGERLAGGGEVMFGSVGLNRDVRKSRIIFDDAGA